MTMPPVSLLLALALTLANAGPPSHPARLSLQPAFTLGLGAGDANTLFGDPTSVGVDSEGNLYVADQLSMRIKVFDRNGDFLRALGGRGRDVGEFLSLAGVHVAPDGTVVVADQVGRRFTWFSPRGAPRTASLDHRTVVWPRAIAASPSGYYLLFRRDRSRNLVHEFDAALSSERHAFGSVDSLTDDPFVDALTDDPFVDAFSYVAPGSLVRWGDSVVVAPAVCDGRLVAYPTDPEGGRGQRLRGEPPERVLDPVASDAPSDDVTVVNGPEGSYAARLYCRGAGLATLGENLLHFSVRSLGDRETLFAEVFGPDGRLQAAHAVSSVRLRRRFRYLPLQVFNAGEGRIAVIDRTGDAPLVRVFDATLT